jgi:hypothetical protein
VVEAMRVSEVEELVDVAVCKKESVKRIRERVCVLGIRFVLLCSKEIYNVDERAWETNCW